jgi:DNA-binding transcriptional LysR family regulator
MDRSKLSSVDLRLFAAVADLGGITAAANRLGLLKSQVSRDLMRLEESLGVRLLQRTTRKVSLTEPGALLAAYARRVVEEMDNAEAALEAMRETPRGDLVVSAPYAFLERHPEIRLAIDPSLRLTDLVEEGDDVAIRVGELPSSSLVARRLAAIPLVLVASPDYIAAHGASERPDDLIRHTIIDLRRDLGGSAWTLVDPAGAPHEAPIRPFLAVGDPGVIRDAALEGLGVAPVPLAYVAEDIAKGRLVRLLPGFTRGAPPIHAVFPSRRTLAPKTRAFVEFVAEIVAQEPTVGA